MQSFFFQSQDRLPLIPSLLPRSLPPAAAEAALAAVVAVRAVRAEVQDPAVVPVAEEDLDPAAVPAVEEALDLDPAAVLVVRLRAAVDRAVPRVVVAADRAVLDLVDLPMASKVA
jgi:hypothetical protein